MDELYTVGALVEIDGAFEDSAGNPVDPTNLTLAVRQPDGTEVAVDPGSFAHPATGQYVGTFPAVQAGAHAYLWLGTGARPVSTDGEFYVREPVTEVPEGWQPATGALVWGDSALDFRAIGYENPGRLDPVVKAAAAWVGWATGRNIDSTLPTTPVDMQALARLSIRMRTEQMAMRTTGDAIQAATTEGISSVSVSGLSVSFRDPRQAAGLGSGRYSSGAPFPTSWDALNEVLLALMTADRLELWRFQVSGTQPPDFAVTELAPGMAGDFQPDPFGWGDPYGPGSGYPGGPAEWPGWGLG